MSTREMPGHAAAGDLVRALRQRAGISQSELAHRAALSLRTVRDIEHGRVLRPRGEAPARLAAALRVTEAERQRLLAAFGHGSAPPLYIGVLGPLLVSHGGSVIDIGPPMQRLLLGTLALHAGQPVLRDEIVDVLWGNDPPRSSRALIYSYVSALRGLLENRTSTPSQDRIIAAAHGGYLLDLEPEQMDICQFDGAMELARRARAAGDGMAAYDHLQAALRFWRGPVLADTDDRLRFHPAAVLASERRVSAAILYADVATELRRSELSLDQLTAVTRDNPLHEGLHGRLMLALAASGESAAALRLYATLRDRLRDELGADPSNELQQIHLGLLRRDVAITSTPPRPAQLPLDVRGFVGRGVELAKLDGLLDAAGEQPTAAVIAAVSGTAGVGKTALAVHWAHRVADRFVDGQLYANLGGFGPSGCVAGPADVVRAFLDALDVPARRVPSGVNAQIGLYRSLLAQRQVLIVLDNARDADHVRPLLPGAPGCMVIVTSRNQLPSLVVHEGAHLLNLDLLNDDEAGQLLARRLGQDRVSREPQAVEHIIRSSAGLPLALAIFAARAATHTSYPLAALAQELRASGSGLAPLVNTDAAANVCAAFTWSYKALDADSARLFRLLGLHPTPDFAAHAAAALMDTPVDRARRLLTELAQASLVHTDEPGRYRFHDLLHAYAKELAFATETNAGCHAVVHRILDHYLITARKGALLLDPHRDLPPFPQRIAGPGEHLANRGQSLRWFGKERRTLVAAVRVASGNGLEQHAWVLASTLESFLQRQGYWPDMFAVEDAALAAAARVFNKVGQAHAQRGLGRVYGRTGRFDAALPHLRTALALFTELEEVLGQAGTCVDLGWVLEQTGDRESAHAMAARAMALYRSAGHRAGEARALNGLGWFSALGEQYPQALAHCERALELFRELGDHSGEAATWDSMGLIHHRLHHYEQARRCYQQALELRRHSGDRDGESDTLSRVGDVYRDAGDPVAAVASWQLALAIQEEIGDPAVDQTRAKVAQAGRGVRPSDTAPDSLASGT